MTKEDGSVDLLNAQQSGRVEVLAGRLRAVRRQTVSSCGSRASCTLTIPRMVLDDLAPSSGSIGDELSYQCLHGDRPRRRCRHLAPRVPARAPALARMALRRRPARSAGRSRCVWPCGDGRSRRPAASGDVWPLRRLCRLGGRPLSGACRPAATAGTSRPAASGSCGPAATAGTEAGRLRFVWPCGDGRHGGRPLQVACEPCGGGRARRPARVRCVWPCGDGRHGGRRFRFVVDGPDRVSWWSASVRGRQREAPRGYAGPRGSATRRRRRRGAPGSRSDGP